MTDDLFVSNLQNQYLKFPIEYLEKIQRFTMTGQSEKAKIINRDNVPFDRYVDIWWLSLCIGVQEGVRTQLEANKWHQFIRAGEVLPSNPWRLLQLQLLAVGITENTEILSNPRKLVSMANEYAATGLPIILDEMLGKSVPIWAMTDFLQTRIKMN